MAGTTSKKKSTRKRRNNGFDAMRKKLEEQRRDILDLYVHDLKEGQKFQNDGAEDLVDRANDAYNREFILSLSGGEREILIEIDEALTRLDNGGFGTCTHCESKIANPRLQAVPWARYCIDCQELSEQGMLFDN